MTTPASGSTLGRSLAIVASVGVLATLVASVVVNPTPAAQREVKLDARRVRDLHNLHDAIERHVNQEGSLPASLATLADKPGVRLAIVDPVTEKPYGFQSTGLLAYQLCATFTTDAAIAPQASGYGSSDLEWAHGIGRQCFRRTAVVAGK